MFKFLRRTKSKGMTVVQGKYTANTEGNIVIHFPQNRKTSSLNHLTQPRDSKGRFIKEKA